VKDNRPVNLDIGTIKLPITAYASILHRVTGVAWCGRVPAALGCSTASLAGPEGFAALASWLERPLAKLVAWGIASALLYHSLAGVKHLIMDFGIGETLEGGMLGARMCLR
jgi:succinate dehydrogenase / fumarate reductase cytochrome b subunit